MENRVIGRYQGKEPGPLVVILGAVHGNEPAGVLAIKEVIDMLIREPSVNPGFHFKGRMVGVIGNLQAYQTKQRFIEKDLNRQWTLDNIQRIEQLSSADLQGEDLELAELHTLLHREIEDTQPEALVLLDLHTTSAEGGIFCIPTDDQASFRLAKALHAPVILGLLDGLDGTLLNFARGNHFEIGGLPRHTLGAAFEAGQHDDPFSVSRSISAIISCLRACGCIKPVDVDNRHDAILRQFSARLPKVTRLRHVHHIRPGDAFKMRPGYINFQPILHGEHLADDVTGPICAPESGLILMPLYQPKGADGFFIVESLDGKRANGFPKH